MKLLSAFSRPDRKKSLRSRSLLGRRNRLLRVEGLEDRRLLAVLAQVGSSDFVSVEASEDFESFGAFTFPGTPFSSGGFDFDLPGSGGDFVIWTSGVGFPTQSAYDNGGGHTMLHIKMTDGTDFRNVQFDVSNGFFGNTGIQFVWLRTYNDGTPTGFDFDFDLTIPATLSVATDGATAFDEIRVASYNSASSRDLHVESTFSATSIDNLIAGVSNSPPQANDDSTSTEEDGEITINVIANDTDPDGDLDPTTVTVTSGPAHGSLTNNGDGSFTYTPSPDFHGLDSFVYEVIDSNGETDTATVTITVNPIADILPDSDTIDEDGPSNLDVLANDTFSDPDAYVSSVTQGANGSVVIELDGSVTYTPNANWHGTDSYTYTVTTAIGSSSNTETSTVTITVNSVIDAVIDVMPGSDKNPINLGSKGVVPIAVLSTQIANGELEDFDATTIDTTTIKLNGIEIDPFHVALEDVDGDGDLDLILHFRTAELVEEGILDENSVDLALTAEYAGGNAIGADLGGSDTVSIVPSNGKGKSGK